MELTNPAFRVIGIRSDGSQLVLHKNATRDAADRMLKIVRSSNAYRHVFSEPIGTHGSPMRAEPSLLERVQGESQPTDSPFRSRST